ncbi:MAG TPA: hypothetical protein VNA68_01580 [Candidatus Dormibacteraeota bacterium]|nr:hypothetical protein [Candidatus Dormibacteraeota bacterium]
MLALAFLEWWYGRGWKLFAGKQLGSIKHLMLAFSVPLLARTLFAPWKQIISYSDDSLAMNMRVLLDNTVSRVVGFGVRIIVLFAAFLLSAIWLAVSLAGLILWPLLPIASIVLIIGGLVWM